MAASLVKNAEEPACSAVKFDTQDVIFKHHGYIGILCLDYAEGSITGSPAYRSTLPLPVPTGKMAAPSTRSAPANAKPHPDHFYQCGGGSVEYCRGWALVAQHHLEKNFTFRNFKDALAFTNQVGAVAEAVHHHPDIYLAWGKVKISLWTHKVDGLTEGDFVLAARIEALQ
jgi:pterin-4a-carbinolamine dehydratase